MHFENQSLNKLKSIIEFLQSSRRFLFQNYHLKILLDFLENDPQISIIIKSLLSNNQHIEEKLTSLPTFENFKLNEVRSLIHTFDEQVALCIFYLGAFYGKEKFIENFIIPTDGIGSHERNKDIFFNECIKPISLYLELEINSSVSALFSLRQYKTLCEWYDREKISSMDKELDITKQHLSKHLFYNGFFNYSLYETNVPSGRIDNLALRLDTVTVNKNINLPNTILAEGKIYRTSKSIEDVFNQVDKRMRDLNLHEGFCVIFNKDNKKLHLVGASGDIDGTYFKENNNSRIYFVIINLHNDFYDSTKTLEPVEIDISTYISIL